MASNTGSPVATDRQEDYEPDWNYVGSDNAPKQRAIAQGTYGSYAKAAQKAGNALAKDRPTDRFDELNQWMDADPGTGRWWTCCGRRSTPLRRTRALPRSRPCR